MCLDCLIESNYLPRLQTDLNPHGCVRCLAQRCVSGSATILMIVDFIKAGAGMGGEILPSFGAAPRQPPEPTQNQTAAAPSSVSNFLSHH